MSSCCLVNCPGSRRGPFGSRSSTLCQAQRSLGIGTRQPCKDAERRRYTESKAQAWLFINRDEIQLARLRGEGSEMFEAAFARVAELSGADPMEKAAACKVVDELTKILHGMSQLKVSRILGGGSLGRSTNVCNSFDVDLLAFVSEFDGRPLSCLDDWRDKELTTEMRRQVAQRLGDQYRLGSQYHGSGRTAHYDDILQLEVNGWQVDLLLLPNCIPGQVKDPASEQHQVLMPPLYEQLRVDPAAVTHVRERERAVSESLIRFVKESRDDIKGVVRLVKAWYKYGLRADGLVHHVTSVVLEVLVLAAQQELERGLPLRQLVFSERHKFPQVELFLATLRLLEAAVTEGAVVMVDAGRWGYRHDDGLRCGPIWMHDAVKVIHPIDPTSNLARPWPGAQPEWRSLAAEAVALRHAIEGDSLGEVLQHSTLGAALRRIKAATSALE